MALLTAQKMGDDLVADAQRKKSDMLAELEMSAETRRLEIDAQLSDEKARLGAAIAEREKFIGDTRQVIEAHLGFLAKIESIKHTPEANAPAPTREETIQSTAKQIDSAVEKAVSPPAAPQQAAIYDEASAAIAEAIEASEPELDDEGDPTRTFMPKTARAEVEETSPRPKFDFDNLKFGVNFEDS